MTELKVNLLKLNANLEEQQQNRMALTSEASHEADDGADNGEIGSNEADDGADNGEIGSNEADDGADNGATGSSNAVTVDLQKDHSEAKSSRRSKIPVNIYKHSYPPSTTRHQRR